MAYNVLIVDDSAVMRTMLRRVLAMAGIDVGEVHEAPNGQVGLECLERSWIDLALIDINMPVMNGEELIQRIRANPSTHDLAVIVVSSKNSASRAERLSQHRVHFIHKPFTAEQIRKTVDEVMGSSHGQAA